MPAPEEELVVIAAVAGAHGVRGDVKIKPFGDPAQVCSYGPFLDKSGAVILTPTQAKPGPNGTVTIRLKENLTREQVQAMKGTLLHAPRSALPELEEDEFYYSDLIGLNVEDLEGEALGKVKSVQDFGAGDLLEISGPDGVWFLPFTKTAVPHMDLAASKLVANPPETIEGDEDKDQ
ncbi:Ribosome maturation factor RimM [Oceanicaulis sp. 350]|nr:Ribosome maturation factor RimM [Oceanicaulis sp. 350]